jgi:ubiquinone/menaquinone biosynthesis C-methylase UbiE
MNQEINEWHRCRVCGSEKMSLYLELPNMPLVDALLREDELGGEFLGAIRLFICEECKLAQTMHDVNVRDYYRDYQYSVGQSLFAVHFMQRLAEKVWHTYSLGAGDSVIEVGSSDGAQLECFQKLGARVLGFEPSESLARVTRLRNVSVIQELFDEDSVEKIPADLRPAQVLLLTHTFDHIPDPMSFLRAARRILDPQRGLLVIEVHDLEKTVERREFCLFAHEHTTYYYAASLQRVLQRAGFDLISTQMIPDAERRGNSLLVVATLPSSVFAEQKLPPLPLGRLGDVQYLQGFGQEVHASLRRLKKFVQTEKQKGIRLAGYGAGGRGVMTLAAIASPGDFVYVADKNPNLNGYYTPGSHIPVVTPNRFLVDPVDKAIVFSFGYFQEIYDDLATFRKQGGELISLLDLF